MATIPGSSLRSSPFALPTSVSVSGTDYPIRTDFRVILEILVMLRDPDLTDADRTEALMRMFFVERPSDIDEAIKSFVSFAQPHPPSRRTPGLVDWEQDFSLIAGPVNHILGTECRSLPYLH